MVATIATKSAISPAISVPLNFFIFTAPYKIVIVYNVVSVAAISIDAILPDLESGPTSLNISITADIEAPPDNGFKMHSGITSDGIPSLTSIGLRGFIINSRAPVLLNKPIAIVIPKIYGKILYITFKPDKHPSTNSLNTSFFSTTPINNITKIVIGINEFII